MVKMDLNELHTCTNLAIHTLDVRILYYDSYTTVLVMYFIVISILNTNGLDYRV